MSVEVFSYTPQAVGTDTTIAPNVVMDDSLPYSDFAYSPTEVMRRIFRLQFTAVTTAEASSMAAFYAARYGPWDAFLWPHPLEGGRQYSVRFDSTMAMELFTPVYFRTGGEIILTMVAS